MSSFTPVDAAVRERVRTELHRNLCVEAGAGTGKTTVLVRRVVELLRTGRVTVDQLVVITFTEAAAAEIAARVRQDLEEALDGAVDPPDRERLHAAIAGLHRARLETIHAFASNLLRERPIEARIDPQFEVLDGLAAGLDFDDAFEKWLAHILAEERPDLARAIAAGFDVTEIRKLVDAVHSHRTLLPLAPEVVAQVDVRGRSSEVARIVHEIRQLMSGGAGDARGMDDCERALLFADRLAAARDDNAELIRTVLFNAPAMTPNVGRAADWIDPVDCKQCKSQRTKLKEWIAEIQTALRSQAIVAVLPLADQFVRDYEDDRRRRGVATFDDLLKWARDLLASSPEARGHARRSYRAILVDEFQDTDPTQAEIALCIASDDEPGDDWLQMRPRPGALTVVGDPKQSIYRFRRADIGMYDSVRAGPLRDGEEQLVQNFRSVEGVLGWANEVFDSVLVEQPLIQPGNTPLRVGSARLSDESRSVVIARGQVTTGADQIRFEEARLVAGTIMRAVEGGWSVRDRDTGEERPATWGDVAILVPRRTALDIYLEVFRRLGVPVRAESGRSFFQRQEVLDLANMLQAIDDPLDAVSLVAALRSTVFGCSDEDIYLYTVMGNRLDVRLAPNEDAPASVREAIEVLRDLNDLRGRVSLAQLVRAVLDKTRLIEIALLGYDGKQSAANLIKLADKARAFSSSGAGGLRAFARWLADQRAASDETEATVAEESDAVVRLLTVHASKGLEFPIVALANISSAPRNDRDPVPDRKHRRLHIRILRKGVEFKTPGFDAAFAIETAQKEAEYKRLLYVGITRARDHVIVPVASAPPANSMLADLLPFVAVAPCRIEIDGATLPPVPDDEPEAAVVATEGDVDDAISERDAWVEGRARVVGVARTPIAVIPATQDEGDQPLSAALLGADDAPLIMGQGPPRKLGEALHKVLELVDLDAPTDLEAVADSVCLVFGVQDNVDDVVAMANACLGSDALARALRADQRWSEVPYTHRVGNDYATGRMDLVYREGDRLSVLDWKSDSIGPGAVVAAAETHRGQAESYRAALSAATGMAVEDVVFVFARAGGASAAI